MCYLCFLSAWFSTISSAPLGRQSLGVRQNTCWLARATMTTTAKFYIT